MDVKSFIESLPSRVSADAIVGHNSVFHFDIEGDEGGQYTVAIVDGVMSSESGLVGDPKCVVKAKASNLVGILTGEINPMTAVFTGKLKVSNPGEMMKYAKIFGLM